MRENDCRRKFIKSFSVSRIYANETVKLLNFSIKNLVNEEKSLFLKWLLTCQLLLLCVVLSSFPPRPVSQIKINFVFFFRSMNAFFLFLNNNNDGVVIIKLFFYESNVK